MLSVFLIGKSFMCKQIGAVSMSNSTLSFRDLAYHIESLAPIHTNKMVPLSANIDTLLKLGLLYLLMHPCLSIFGVMLSRPHVFSSTYYPVAPLICSHL
jgi:hypothetical protein